MKFLRIKSLMVAVCAFTQQLIAETDAPAWITAVDRLPHDIEEKLYVIPTGIVVKRTNKSVAVEVELVFVSGFKSSIFLNKPETKDVFAQMAIHKDGVLIASNGQGADKIASDDEDYVFLKFISIGGKGGLSRRTSSYAARFLVTLKNDDPVGPHLSDAALRSGSLSVVLLFGCKLFTVSGSEWKSCDAFRIEARQPAE